MIFCSVFHRTSFPNDSGKLHEVQASILVLIKLCQHKVQIHGRDNFVDLRADIKQALRVYEALPSTIKSLKEFPQILSRISSIKLS